MGGKALKEYGVVRISPEAYQERLKKLNDWMAELPDSLECDYFVPGQVVKEDYGDMDVLFTSTNPKVVVDFFKEKFASKGAKKNGNCTSVEWDEFQVDFIHFREEVFPFACHYYSHGTYAAILGKVMRYYHLKLGWDGLSFTLRTKNGKYERLLTRDWGEAMTLMGYKTYLKKEWTFPEEDLFKHLISSPLMQKHIFRDTKPDRNYGFQEKFFIWVDSQPDVGDKERTRSYGWFILWQHNPRVCVELAFKQGLMWFEETTRPIKRVYRKVKYQYLYPVAFKCRGML
jgi:hypothetical protein